MLKMKPMQIRLKVDQLKTLNKFVAASSPGLTVSKCIRAAIDMFIQSKHVNNTAAAYEEKTKREKSTKSDIEDLI